jgi:hypothetical protein
MSWSLDDRELPTGETMHSQPPALTASSGRWPAGVRLARALLALALVLLAAACPAEPDEAAPTPTPTPPEPFPLTGLPADDPDLLERPVLAVKIDNIGAARPQTGLEDADVVMVELVEGTTRLLALYQSADPGVVGPVRSGRLLQAELLPPFEPVFAMSGARGPVGRELREALRVVYEEGQAGGWIRDPDRSAPHNLYVTASELWDHASDLPRLERFWRFEEDPPAGGSEATALEVTYPMAGSSGWEWDAAAEHWLRLQDGEPHVTVEDERLAADTVVVTRLPTTGRVRLPVDPIGEGEATVFRDGQQFDARWRKPSREEHFESVTPEGGAFALKPGQSWFELLPDDGTLDVEVPADG